MAGPKKGWTLQYDAKILPHNCLPFGFSGTKWGHCLAKCSSEVGSNFVCRFIPRNLTNRQSRLMALGVLSSIRIWSNRKLKGGGYGVWSFKPNYMHLIKRARVPFVGFSGNFSTLLLITSFVH